MNTPRGFKKFLDNYKKLHNFKKVEVFENENNFFILFSSEDNIELFQFENRTSFKSFVFGVITAMKVYKK